MSKSKADSLFEDQAVVFRSQGASKAKNITAGETTIFCLHNGNPQLGINALRCQTMCAKVATTTDPVQPSTLSPTSASVKYHSLNV